jgi:hypothetical protein
MPNKILMLRKALAFCILILIVAVSAPDIRATTVVKDPTKKKGAGAPFQIRRGKKWGFMDRTGKVIIEPQFEAVNDFFQGRAAVLKNGKWGYINESGMEIIPFSFDGALDFTGEIAPVLVGRKWGYIDLNGRWIISPRFQAAAEMKDGLARVLHWERLECSRKTYTNENAPIYTFQMPTIMTAMMSGCAPLNGRYGFVDPSGKFAIQPSLQWAEDFSEGLASFGIQHKFGYVDAKGKTVISPRFESAANFSDGLAAVRLDGKEGYIDKTGQWVIEPKFDFAGQFSEGLARVLVSIGTKAGYIDKTGKLVIELQNEYGWDFSEGLAPIYNDNDDNGHRYIDRTGKTVLRLAKARWGFSDGLTVVGEYPTQVYVDKHGKVIAPYEVGSEF